MVDRLRILPGLTQFGAETPDDVLPRAVLREQPSRRASSFAIEVRKRPVTCWSPVDSAWARRVFALSSALRTEVPCSTIPSNSRRACAHR
ncbi:hypothetical protein GS491_26600 [Rhodococcus hoagii]|nr:hypothetical protein [Prescottella equi]